MTREEWRPVAGWPYEVSNRGRVRRSSGGQGTVAGHVLAGAPSPEGYMKVALYRDGGGRNFYVHRLVAAAFIGSPCGRQVNHLNFDRRDNRVANLEYVSRSGNLQHAARAGRMVSGEDHPWSKLTWPEVRQMRRRYAGGARQARIAESFGVDPGLVSRIVRNKAWKERTA